MEKFALLELTFTAFYYFTFFCPTFRPTKFTNEINVTLFEITQSMKNNKHPKFKLQKSFEIIENI